MRQWASPHQSGSQPEWVHMVLVAAADVIHSLSPQISGVRNLPDDAEILSQPFLVVEIFTVTPDIS